MCSVSYDIITMKKMMMIILCGILAFLLVVNIIVVCVMYFGCVREGSLVSHAKDLVEVNKSNRIRRLDIPDSLL